MCKTRRGNHKLILTEEEIISGGRLGMDSHADMSCIGAHASIFEIYEGQLCNVMPFNDSYTPMHNICTVNAVFAYDSDDGNTYILNVNQGLDFSSNMKHSLLCPNQARLNGVVIDDCPKALDYHGRSTHSIYFPEKDIRLPLLTKFPTSFLPVCRPSQEDLDTCPTLDLTSSDHWAPELFDKMDISAASANSMVDAPLDLSSVLTKEVHVHASTMTCRKSIEPHELARLWNISLPNAKRTLECTTQDYIRKLDVPSIRGNKYIQLFCNRGNYTKSYPMKQKGFAHHALDRFLHEAGIPCELLTDGALELTKSDWGKTCIHHKIRQTTTEPYSPWQNPAELAGGLIKRKVRYLMQSCATPVVLWDYCWEYVSELRSLTATDNIFNDQVTAFEKVHGYNPDISELLVFKWDDWVWYHDPNHIDKKQLGR